MKNLFLRKKLDVDYETIKYILEVRETAIINCEYILLDIKPYRRSIFLQIYGKKNGFEKIWKKYTPEQKMEWISNVLLDKYPKEEFVEHILKAINMFSSREDIVNTFYLALEVDLKEVKQNV